MDEQRGDSIEDRLTLVLHRIQRAIREAGRSKGSVQLVAATKMVSVDRIHEAISAGLQIAGESRLQEALPKIEALRREPIRWHFLGTLQRRKVRSVVGVFDLIHSVDSLELAEEIDRRAKSAGLQQNILLEINVGKEKSKAGFSDDEVERLLPQLATLEYVTIKGLMTIPPPVRDAEEARPFFRRLRELAVRLTQQRIPRISMAELSMGMSSDYVVAIEEGATLVRVGTAIFGVRHG
jgi:pyridoxal phosphate enzyme (YggS family)